MLNEILSRRTLYQAFERIRDNGGCRGADGVSLGDFAENLEQELDNLQDRLIRRVYHPYPLLRFEVPKNESKMRALCVPAVRDRVLQTAVYLVTRMTKPHRSARHRPAINHRATSERPLKAASKRHASKLLSKGPSLRA